MNMDVNQDSRQTQPAPSRLTPFALGFRPFFLGAAAWAVFEVLLWLAIYRGAEKKGTKAQGKGSKPRRNRLRLTKILVHIHIHATD